MGKLVKLMCMAAAVFLTGCGFSLKANAQEGDRGPLTFGPQTQVKTTYGTYQGYLDGDVYTFKGIKYAKAERFMEPQDPDSFEGVRMARIYGPKAPQNQTFRYNGRGAQTESNFANNFIMEPMDESECLVLNVWTKGINDGKKRPVFVWIHGGGYATGSGHDLPCYEGWSLAKKGDIVFVNLNHRLNILGYLDLSSFGGKYENSVNLGMKDIVKALEWIHKNIEGFGGDPNQVTIGGQSGGGGKVSTLLCMPSAKGLFHRAIVQSGSLYPLAEPVASQKYGEAVVKALGLNASNLDKLADFSYDELTEAGRVALAELRKELAGQPGRVTPRGAEPTVDGKSISCQPYVATAPPKESWNVPLLVGSNANEFGAPKPDTTFRVGAINHARVWASRTNGAKCWRYFFAWCPESNSLGAMHGMELPFMFNNVALQREMTGGSARAYKLQETVSDYWLNFIKTGDPNGPGLPKWDAFNLQDMPLMILDDNVRQENHVDDEFMQMWKH